MYRVHSILPFLFVLLTGITVQATAAPSVLVTVPALHSLVSGLMDGIAEPELLMDNPDHSTDLMLSGSQLRMLANTDMIVWSGPGLEKGLYDAVENKAPAARHKLVTLSAMVPLLANGQNGGSDPANYRNDARNLEFWADPRLSIIAIRTLTPRLVRLDPDNTERYLDNEISLIKRLRELEKEMANAAAFLAVDLADMSSDSNPYFLHRMQLPVIAATNTQYMDLIATDDCRNSPFKKVAAGLDKITPGAQPESSVSYGPDFYFDMMQAAIENLLKSNCDATIQVSELAPAG